MTDTRLISNSNYHVVLTPSGGGYSRWGALAVTRWRQDAALDGDADLNLRRLRIVNHTALPRTLSATNPVEIVLAPPAADAAQPAFSKLFVETRIEPDLPAIFATPRPSKPDDTRAWLFHRAIVTGIDATLSFNTDRAHFIGRGHGRTEPVAVF